MLSSNGTLTSYLASPLPVHSPVFQHSHLPPPPPSPPIARSSQFPDPLFREIEDDDIELVSLRHGNRLSRRSLNLGGVRSPVAMVHAMNQGTRRVVVHDNGTVATTTSANSLFSAFEVLFLCRVAAELGSVESPPLCHYNGTTGRGEESPPGGVLLRSVLLLFLRSQRFLCVSRKGTVYSLAKRGNYRRKVDDCVFQHEVVLLQYDTYYTHRHSTPPPPPSPPPRDVGRRRYLSVINSKVVTRKMSTAKHHPPKTAFFIQVHLKNMANDSIYSDQRLTKNSKRLQRKTTTTTTTHDVRTSNGRIKGRRRTKTPDDSHLWLFRRTTPQPPPPPPPLSPSFPRRSTESAAVAERICSKDVRRRKRRFNGKRKSRPLNHSFSG